MALVAPGVIDVLAGPRTVRRECVYVTAAPALTALSCRRHGIGRPAGARLARRPHWAGPTA